MVSSGRGVSREEKQKKADSRFGRKLPGESGSIVLAGPAAAAFF
jgi:hypothetical protein